MKIGIIMGSASDKELVSSATKTLDALGADYEVTIASAHRTPKDVEEYSCSARSRGLACIIAVAGLSAALPGVVAAHTDLPVIGLPVGCGPLKGQDALYAMAMMPPGVPVATVGIDSAANAALFAARILATHDPKIAQALANKKEADAQKVRASREELSWPKP